jgi:chromate reductase
MAGPSPTTRILAVCGSLRAASLNARLLRAAARLAPPDIHVELFRGVGDLPLFNPDIEASDPSPVVHFRTCLMAADGVLIASPEYAHGVTGAMKNALDWMVGCEAFVNKPVALLNASPRAVHAQASLKETLTVMTARVVEEASVSVPLLGSRLDEAGIVADLAMSAALREALCVFQRAIARHQAEDAGLGAAT